MDSLSSANLNEELEQLQTIRAVLDYIPPQHTHTLLLEIDIMVSEESSYFSLLPVRNLCPNISIQVVF